MHMLFAARLPSREVSEPRRQIVSSEGSRFPGWGLGGCSVLGAAEGSAGAGGGTGCAGEHEGAAGPAGQEDLPSVALFFNHFLPLLVFIAHIFPVTVSLGFHPF